MSKYIGDYSEDYATLNFKFTARQFSTGAPFTLGGTPALSVYKQGSDTESTAGLTLTVDYDGRTGLNDVVIDLSADAFYEAGKDYEVVITTGTVDSVSVVGEVVALFSIENRTTYPKADVPANFSVLGIETDGDLTKVNTLDGHTAQTADHAASIAAILVDTAEIGAAGAGLTAIPWNAAWDTEVQSEVDDALTAFGCSTVTTAQVNTEVSDVIKTDTYTLPGQTAPPLAPTFEQAVMWLYKVLRNRSSQTATQWSLYADDESTVDAKSTVSDDGSVATKEEIVSGP